ncbi:DUF1659 domain-containing protein [Clostridium fungisolvens]|uniref:DUF1659 domain-containing protein n=1 Tax=Clostridium fungisolvens TaxID=1604897 RepID=A0A6V8SGV2_9CLOT|nr:DUF1659 domain-containing protein [Clostridium fungisolvens]GFP76407.1 hypothetical protein bsdtw1_02509 [Clostridium fungisolvens]
MAVSKVLQTSSMYIEIENGTDKLGATVYKKKNFSGVKTNATPENVYAVAEAIKAVLSVGTRDAFLTETSKLANA